MDDEVKIRWQTFNDVLRRPITKAVKKAVDDNISMSNAVKSHGSNTLNKAPPSWVVSAVDNPYGPIEKRAYFKRPEEVAFVSTWANKERHKVASSRSKYELDFMIFDSSTRRWIMKPDITSGKVEVKKAPKDWWKDKGNKKTPVIRYKERMLKKAIRNRERLKGNQPKKTHLD
ncbi:hypothetical protein FA10DRAFT_291540 [Acaromyces ingoldii]|uniref:Uncharacterized protein n=1 Tax=Acaromyces ingoldii TaxID=215250 RepID=A0A316YYL6_9BASI|nr:hypothetical protein FA10DRAFT_291540 [Acaromyces ingoldii]PWN94281.1 hypothetical protein FA10DRAFT_291540 [Acaromyces ingoldii]